MSALLDIQQTESWQQQHEALLAELPGNNVDWLKQQREQGIARFAELGLPTIRDEQWRYTDLRELKKNAFRLSPSETASYTSNGFR